jgi:hypothetical protein
MGKTSALALRTRITLNLVMVAAVMEHPNPTTHLLEATTSMQMNTNSKIVTVCPLFICLSIDQKITLEKDLVIGRKQRIQAKNIPVEAIPMEQAKIPIGLAKRRIALGAVTTVVVVMKRPPILAKMLPVISHRTSQRVVAKGRPNTAVKAVDGKAITAPAKMLPVISPRTSQGVVAKGRPNTAVKAVDSKAITAPARMLPNISNRTTQAVIVTGILNMGEVSAEEGKVITPARMLPIISNHTAQVVEGRVITPVRKLTTTNNRTLQAVVVIETMNTGAVNTERKVGAIRARVVLVTSNRMVLAVVRRKTLDMAAGKMTAVPSHMDAPMKNIEVARGRPVTRDPLDTRKVGRKDIQDPKTTSKVGRIPVRIMEAVVLNLPTERPMIEMQVRTARMRKNPGSVGGTRKQRNIRKTASRLAWGS